MPRPALALLLAAGLVAVADASTGACVGNLPIYNGTCYSGYTGICSPYVGSTVYLPLPGPINPYKNSNGTGLSTFAETIALIEANVKATVALVRENSGILGQTCSDSTDWYAYVCIMLYRYCLTSWEAPPSTRLSNARFTLDASTTFIVVFPPILRFPIERAFPFFLVRLHARTGGLCVLTLICTTRCRFRKA